MNNLAKLSPVLTACAALIMLGVSVTSTVHAAYIFTDLGDTGSLGYGSIAYDINSAGQVVGSSYPESYYYHATLWNGTTASNLGTLNGLYSNAQAINNAGLVAGWSSFSNGLQPPLWNDPQHATLWNGTTAIDLGTLGGSNSYANAINDSSQVVGYSNTTGNAATHATLWNGTTMIDLGTLGGTSSQASDINNSGQVVGWSYSAGNTVALATLWNGTTAIDLNSYLDATTISAGWYLESALGINDSGWIVGRAGNRLTGQTHGFLLSDDATAISPVPEPSTYAMLLAGLGLLGFTAQRKYGLGGGNRD